MTRYRNRYRIESVRLQGYDYAAPGWYHVVVCTHGRAHTLGEIRGGVVGLSEAGSIVAEEWQRTPVVRRYVTLDAWVVMPNHVHVIIGIKAEAPDTVVETSRRDVSARTKARLRPCSLGAIVNQVKSVCTKRIRRTCVPSFVWQPRFYDRVIRNERELQATRRYIADNPMRWNHDRNRHTRP